MFCFPKLIQTQLSKGLISWKDLSVVLTRGRRMGKTAFVSHSYKPRIRDAMSSKRFRDSSLQLLEVPAGLTSCWEYRMPLFDLLCCPLPAEAPPPTLKQAHLPSSMEVWVGGPVFVSRERASATSLSSVKAATRYRGAHSQKTRKCLLL